MSTDEKILDTYYRVVKIADRFLETATGLSIEALKDYDPSIELIAKNIMKLAEILRIFANDSDHTQNGMAINANQCAITIASIGQAVAASNEDEVLRLLHQLEGHVCVP